ncbi:hypothetical protein ACFL2Q_01490 [Thermodesulfobacteriota bacterium]
MTNRPKNRWQKPLGLQIVRLGAPHEELAAYVPIFICAVSFACNNSAGILAVSASSKGPRVSDGKTGGLQSTY